MKIYFLIKLKEKLKNLFKKKENSLLDVASKQKKSDKQLKDILNKNYNPLWMPSIPSFFRIFLIMLFFWIISHPKYVLKYFFLPSFSLPIISDKFDPIAIHTGIGAVLIGLAFFVAQSLTDKGDSEKSRVLLYKSMFFPLLMAEIMAFFFFIGETNILGFVPVILIALWTILSLGSVINILVKDHKMEEAKKEVLLSVTIKNFSKILDREITQRIGNNIIYKKYENSEILNISPFGFFDKKNVVSIKSSKSGLILDIKLNELEKLVFELNKAININIASQNIDTTNSGNTNIKQEPVCYLKPLLGYKIEVGDKLFDIKKHMADCLDIHKLEKISRDIFIIKKDDSEIEAHTEVSKLKDKCILAINNHQTGELEKIIRLYAELVNSFFKYLSSYHGGCFSSEQARQERGLFFDRLKPLEWISKDILEIFERGINSSDIIIIGDVAYLPILLTQQAIESKDHLIFQEFIGFSRLLYEKAFEFDKEGKIKEAGIMFDRTWRYLKELSVYHLESKLKDEEYPEQDFKDYYIQIFKTFQELLKSSFDKKDLSNFEKFLSVVSELINRSDRPYNNFPHPDDENVFDYLKSKRQEMLFGVASWILSILKNKSEDASIKHFYDAVQNKLPSKVEEFADVFLKVHDFKVEDFWGWGWWESKPDEGVHRINISEKLEQFFVVKSLSLLMSINDREIDKISLPHNRDLAFLAEGTRDVMGTIDDIDKNPKNWSFVLAAGASEKCSALRKLLKKAHKQQEEEDLKRKRELRISKEKVDKFKQSLILNYRQSDPIKELLKYLGLYIDKTSKKSKQGIKKMGVNTLFDKAAFFDDKVNWHVHYSGIDEAFGFGRSMANGENKEIVEAIEIKSTRITEDSFEDSLSSTKSSNLVILVTGYAIWRFLGRLAINFIPKWHQNFPKGIPTPMAEGVYKFKKGFIPVYQVFTPNSEHLKIFILDKSKLGKFIQYSPLDEKEKFNLMCDVFSINIREFIPKSNLTDEFLNNPQPWLKEIGVVDKQVEYLQEHVLIQVYERFNFVVNDNFQGYVLNVNRKKECDQ